MSFLINYNAAITKVLQIKQKHAKSKNVQDFSFVHFFITELKEETNLSMVFNIFFLLISINAILSEESECNSDSTARLI